MASEGLELPQEVDYDVEEKQGEKEASKFQAKLTEFGVSIPKSSAMNIMLRRLQLKFRAHSERDAHWHGQKLEDARIDRYVNKFKTHRDYVHSASHQVFGLTVTEGRVKKAPFEYFHLINDDELEEATNNLVRAYTSDNKAGTWNAHRHAEVGKYLGILQSLRKTELTRLEGFQKPEFNDLHMTNAFMGIPLYQTLQSSSGKGKKGQGRGPYEYGYNNRRASRDADPDYVTKAARNAGLTSTQMSTIMIQTGHKIAAHDEREGYDSHLHGLEEKMFTKGNYTQLKFGEHFAHEMNINNEHLLNVLGKIGLEHQRFSTRPEVEVVPEKEAEAEAAEDILAVPRMVPVVAPADDGALLIAPDRKKGPRAQRFLAQELRASLDEQVDQYHETLDPRGV